MHCEVSILYHDNLYFNNNTTQFEDISESKRKAKHDVCDFMIKFNEISSKTGADFVTQLITLYDEEVS